MLRIKRMLKLLLWSLVGLFAYLCIRQWVDLPAKADGYAFLTAVFVYVFCYAKSQSWYGKKR